MAFGSKSTVIFSWRICTSRC